MGLAVAAVTILALAPSASAAEANCPGTFDVLHNDRIGSMQLPKGPYVVTVLDTATMGCTEASRLFSEFLEDYDGRLPRPWVATNSTRTFQAGRGSSVGFRVTPGTGPSPPTPPAPPSPRICPGYFSVLHNDRIGSFRIAKGKYRITLLSYRGVTCQRAVSLFQRFLQDYDGVLPRPWLLDPGTGTFSRGHRHVGFRIKPYVSEGSGQQGGTPGSTPERRPIEVPCDLPGPQQRQHWGVAPEEGQLQRLGTGPELPTLEPAVRPVPPGCERRAAQAMGPQCANGNVQARQRPLPRQARSPLMT